MMNQYVKKNTILTTRKANDTTSYIR